MQTYSYPLTPVPKPRMTQRDRWAKRPVVLKYFKFCDELRAMDCELPESGAKITFQMPMPKTWSKKKRAEMLGQPHRQRPDVDNMLKALQDAVHEEDSHIWNVEITKLWSNNGSIDITY